MEELIATCRTCGKATEYANLFYNINRELLKSLISLVQVEMTENDGFSKFLCKDCVEKIEDYTKFKSRYEETSARLIFLLQSNIPENVDIDEPSVSSKLSQEDLSRMEAVVYEIEAIDESSECELQAIITQDSIHEITMVEDVADSTVIPEPITTENRFFPCLICSKVYVHIASLARHVKISHENLRHHCPMCSSSFTQKSSLQEHMKNLHTDTAFSDLKCEYCNKTFNTMKMFQQHTRLHKTEVRKKSITKDREQKRKPRQQCQICGLFFKYIEEHKLKHQTENTFKCDFPKCDKSFKFKTSLTVHQRVHSNERKFECNVCKKKFRVSHHLSQHMSVHAKEKMFACVNEGCKKQFSSKLNLYKHTKVHLKKSNK